MQNKAVVTIVLSFLSSATGCTALPSASAPTLVRPDYQSTANGEFLGEYVRQMHRSNRHG